MNHPTMNEEADTHLEDYAEEYRRLAFATVHGHEHKFADRNKLPQAVRDWLYDGRGTIDEPVAVALEQLHSLRVLEVVEAVATLRDPSGRDLKADAFALLRRRLAGAS